MWKVVKQLFGTFKQKNKIMEINGKTENVEIAEEINQFFADICDQVGCLYTNWRGRWFKHWCRYEQTNPP